MVLMNDLPLEIFLYTRDYLHPEKSVEVLRKYDSFDERCITQEAKWSWRNFLSMSTHEYWQVIRRHTIILSLNKYESRKYLLKESFRNSVNAVIADPSKQLELTVEASPSLPYSSMMEILMTSSVSSLFSSSIQFEKIPIPNISSLHTLIISQGLPYQTSHELSFPNLRVLHLGERNRPIHSNLGNFPLLSVLRIDCFVSVNSLNAFPLEQLEELAFICNSSDFLPSLARMKSLITLEFNKLLYPADFSLPKLPMPFLRSLTVWQIRSIDVSGLKNLKRLKVGSVKQINGLSDIYPTLRYFSVTDDAQSLRETIDTMEDMGISVDSIQVNELCPLLNSVLYESNKALKVDVNLTSSESFYSRPSLSIHPKINSFQIKMGLPYISAGDYEDEKSQERYFQKVRLDSVTLRNISMFKNVHQLILRHCYNLDNISAVRNVPYLTIDRCQNINDFSCLGSQRCLALENINNMKNQDIENLGNVRFLRIVCCDGLSEVKSLSKNLYLYIIGCNFLQNIHLTGTDYIAVYISLCSQLQHMEISGKVYCCELTNCTLLDLEELERYSGNVTNKHW
jgi:hypothetical protein